MIMSGKGRAEPRKEKVGEVEALAGKLKHAKVVGVLSLHKMPAAALQKIRNELAGTASIKVVRKNLIKLALESAGRSELAGLLGSQPAIMVSDTNPFKLYRTIKRSKSPAAAKPGDLAPDDIIVPAGPTDIPPGPAISALTKVKIAARVEGGKIAVAKDSPVAKMGEVISSDLASALSMLKMQPMSVGLDVVGIWEDGTLYKKDVLDVDEDKVRADFAKAIANAFNLSVNAGWPTRQTISIMLGKGFREAKALGLEAGILDKGVIEDLLAKAQLQAKALAQKTGTS
jgi:large subunit ribosomal protein L10